MFPAKLVSTQVAQPYVITGSVKVYKKLYSKDLRVSERSLGYVVFALPTFGVAVLGRETIILWCVTEYSVHSVCHKPYIRTLYSG